MFQNTSSPVLIDTGATLTLDGTKALFTDLIASSKFSSSSGIPLCLRRIPSTQVNQ